jgi:NADH-quinone oxidoreductase subunit E
MNDRLRTVLSRFHGSKEEVIPILQQVQAEYGYLPEQEMFDIARFTGVSESQVFGVATFYAQFRFTPIGRNRIMVCRGTACHVKGARRILEEIENQLGIKEGETTPDGEHSLETVACIGACSLSPCIMINKTVEAKMTPKKVKQLYGEGR